MRARDQSSIFSTGGKFHPDYGLLLELHALTLVARSYALLLHLTLSCDKKTTPGSPRLHNFNVCILEHGSLGTRLPVAIIRLHCAQACSNTAGIASM